MRLSKIVVGVLIALSLQAHAEKVDINFNNLNISDAIKMVGKITGKNILIDGEIKGKINFISNEPVEKSELIPIINAILSTKKMTLVPKGDYYQVVKINDASGEGLPVRSNISQGGTMETVVFQLNSVNAAVIRTKIKPLLHKSAKVVSFKKNNLLAITAYPHSLKSIKKLIDKIERGEKKRSRVITLQHALVKDIFPNIQSMSKELFAQDIVSEKVSVMKNDGSNSVILVGNSRNLNKLVQYIEQLDIEGEERDVQRMFVIPLENSNVEDMEKILSKILPQMTGNLATGGSIHAIAKGAKIPPRKVGATNRSPIAKNEKVQKAVIASDLERNALIVLANSAQIENIRETVRLLDIEKSQVYIKTKIVEVNTNLAENIGVKYGFSGGAITSKGVFSLLASSGAAPLAISPSLMSFLNQGGTKTLYNEAGNPIGTETESRFAFDSGIKEVFSTGIQLDLLKQNGAAQVLSEPSILCTNNKPSSIYVGQTQSIITQSQQSTQGSSNVLNNYSREDIGITLNVKPRLSSNNKVSLEVETTIEDVLPGSGAAADRPTTTKRSVKTNAIVNHGETIILGGLIKTSTGKSSTRVPVLGDIPILGRLFTSQGEGKNKINVVIYLTPYIVKKSSDLKTLRKNLDELDSIQQKFNKIVLNKLEKRKNGI
ncbi:type II secretion system secretin GspD [Sulfurovum sp. bin170]|uniref:type II secretion system secretin GspD n=1 Tax=Sulfurovum sp. bin170 TaxID=2695268 RepID=UPI0013DF1E5C|nr:type II secretion system secretin GspD [Sulfurovum sp. bin170]NEW61149.1 type II secretion system secretin GspD [Sulfurovum sp. bin170]